MTNRLTTEQLEAIRKRSEKASKSPYSITIETSREDIPALLAEIKRLEHLEISARMTLYAKNREVDKLRNLIAWGVSCTECSNQLAEDWRIFRGSFICAECSEEFGGDTE